MKERSPTRRQLLRGVTAGLMVSPATLAQSGETGEPDLVRVGDSVVEVAFAGASFDAAKQELLEWVKECATAVARYYRRFPVAKARLTLVARDGRDGVGGGRTWGGRGARTRITIGQHTSVDRLRRDWVLTHEFVHYAFP